MDKKIVIVSISAGTALLFLGLVAVLSVAILAVHQSSHKQAPSIAPALPGLRQPMGSIGDNESREKALTAEYGPVNTSKLKEDKQGLLFNRNRSRATVRMYSSYPAPRPAYATNRANCCSSYPQSYAPQPISLPIAVVETPVYPSYRLPSVVPIVPSRSGEAYREIDPKTCDGNSCALKPTNLIQSIFEGPFE